MIVDEDRGDSRSMGEEVAAKEVDETSSLPQIDSSDHYVVDPASSISVNCYRCESVLADLPEVSFFLQNPHSLHLSVKHEFTDIVATRSLTMTPQTNSKRKSLVPFVLHCRSCGHEVGSEALIGPKRESVLCFSAGSSYIKCQLAGKLQPSWPDMMRFLPQVEARNLGSFFGSASTSVGQDSRQGKPVLSTIRATRHDLAEIRLSDLTRDKPRPYQIECYTVAALANTVVYLPTGAGKTLVAAMVAALMKRLNPQKMVVFVVDRIPLVFQQGEYMRMQTGQTVLVACGELGSGSSHREIMAHDAVCCTAQVLLNMVDTGRLRMADVACLIMDEVHHASKNHPYVSVLQEYGRTARSCRPLFLGMTASPATGTLVEAYVKMADVSKMASAHYFTPCLTFAGLQQAANRPKIGFAVIEQSAEEARMRAIIDEHLAMVLGKASGLLDMPGAVLRDISCSDLQESKGFVCRLEAIAHERRDQDAVQVIHHLKMLCTSYEVMSVLGARHTRDFLAGHLAAIATRPDIWSAHEIHAAQATAAALQHFQSISPKAACLVQLLRQTRLDTDTRIIVFVQMKKTARWLAQLLASDAHLRQHWNPFCFTGQAPSTIEGMSWVAEQEPLLNQFRAGTVRLLVSTSVLQEGLDVPACNKIILFDRTWSLTSFVQSRGRARHTQSEYIVICSDSERLFYTDLMRSEENVFSLITGRIREANVLLDKAVLVCHLIVEAERLRWRVARDCANDIAEASAVSEPIIDFAVFLCVHGLADVCKLRDMLQDDGARITEMRDPLFRGHTAASVHLPEMSAAAGDQWGLVLSVLCRLSVLGHIACTVRPLECAFPAQRLFLVAEAISFGWLGQPTVLSAGRSVAGTVRVSFNFAASRIDIVFADGSVLWRLLYGFPSLDRTAFFSMQPMAVQCSLLLPTVRPPVVFHTRHMDSVSELKMADLDQLKWTRSVKLPFAVDCNGVLLSFELSPSSQKLFVGGLERLREAGILALFAEKISLSACSAVVPECTIGSDTLFLIESIRANCFVFRLPSDLVREMAEYSDEQLKLLSEELPVRLQADRFGNVHEMIDEILAMPIASVQSLPKLVSSLSNSCFVKMLIVTPQRMVYLGEKMMSRNRVTRRFPPAHFLRVQFRDEDLSTKLSTSHSEACLKECLERFHSLLSNGIEICRCKFDFLAMSSSQIREHGCWFVRPFELDGANVDADYIRNWCGDFSTLRNVAKYVARLGQSFSSSLQSGLAKGPCAVEVPDIETASADGGTFCFSDGIGMISWQLAASVAATLGRSASPPCAYQIRYAGYKGVVALDPRTPDSVDEWLKLRPSMRKFESQQCSLDILNCAEYIPGYLNRQVIMILSGLGVPDSSFTRLHDAQLMEMASMLLDSRKAWVALRSYYRRGSMNLCSTVHYQTEPFFRSLLLAVYQKQLYDLLAKSRIFCSLGRILMGTIDESLSLAKDQVFIQCTRSPRDGSSEQCVQVPDDRFVVVGPVAIAKNPCMHPGDIRVLTAVRCAVLEACRWDVIVFPAVGPRPIADMCSGSDLDGDLYNVVWLPDLIPPTCDPPMDYSAARAKEHPQVIGVKEMSQFMVDFIANDQLGTIANAHVALVDQSPLGVRDPMCMALSHLFSQAVDFPKTGVVASVPEGASVDSYPDFMSKSDHPMYVSNKVIGRMFRKARLAYEANWRTVSVRVDPLFAVECADGGLAGQVASIHDEYRESVRRLLNLYGIRHEAQVLTSSILDLSASAVGNMKEDAKQMTDIIQAAFSAIQAHAKERLMALAAKHPLEQVASQAYRVCYEQASQCSYPIGLDSHVLSFPWILGETLEAIHSKSSFHAGAGAPAGWWFDACTKIAMDMLQAYKHSESSSMLAGHLDRLEAVASLSDALGCDCEVTGSSCLGLFSMTSNINISCPGLSLEAVQKEFPHAKMNGQSIALVHNGYSIVFAAKEDRHDQVRRWIHSDEWNYLTAWVLIRWARSRRLVGRKISSVQLLSVFIDYIDRIGLKGVVREAELGGMELFLSIHNRLAGSCQPSAKSGMQLLRFLQVYSLDADSPEHQQLQLPIPTDVSEAAFRAFHLLAQTLDINVLWREADGQMERPAGTKSVQFVTKGHRSGTTSSAIFMAGASRIFFDRSSAARDPVTFGLYQYRRRPQHGTAQCYRATLRRLHGASDFCKTEYYAHAFRQMVRISAIDGEGTEHALYGSLKGHIKLGRIYFTHLPRMFLEEGAGTAELIQRALEKAYKSVDEAASKSLMRVAKSSSVQLDTCRGRHTEPVDAGLKADTVESILARQAKSVPDEQCGGPRKRSISAMVSSFESCISNSDSAHQFIQEYSFVVSPDPGDHGDGVSVSMAMFDGLSGCNSEFQLQYNHDMTELVKVVTRPLRWLSIDIRSASDDCLDWRFTLSSAKKLNFSTHVKPVEMLDNEPVVCKEHLSTLEDSRIFVRSTKMTRFLPTPMTYELLKLPQEFHFALSLSHVIEWDKASPVDGKFQYCGDKMELDVLLLDMRWGDWSEGAIHRDRIIKAVWTLATALQSRIR